MNAAEILAIPVHRSRALFPGDPDAIKKRFHELALEWHPDRRKDANAEEVFQHISELHKASLQAASPRVFASADGSVVRIQTVAESRFSAGEVLVHAAGVDYAVSESFASEAQQAKGFMPAFASDRMSKEMGRFLPAPGQHQRLRDGWLLRYSRTEDQILLADLLRFAGALKPADVAWVISGMMNIACWLSWSRICHGDISPEMLLISPRYHSVALTGPLLYRQDIRKRPKVLPARTLSAIPRLRRSGEVVDGKTDPLLIRLTAMACLGDERGGNLLSPAIPRPLARWLMLPPAASAIQDYAGWEMAREEAFGNRKFHDMQIGPEQVYPG